MRFAIHSVDVGVLVLAAAAKQAYSTAGADALGFVLGPSCFVAAHLGGLSFVHEAGAGYVLHAPRMIVGPACAGMNFLVVAFLALYATLRGRIRGPRARIKLAMSSALAAYAMTVLANGVRIALAAELLTLDRVPFALDGAEAHRLLGILLYTAILFVVCALADRSLSGAAGERGHGPEWALALYLGLTLGVPLLHHGASALTPRFLEHAAFTLLGAGAVLALVRAADRLLSRVDASS